MNNEKAEQQASQPPAQAQASQSRPAPTPAPAPEQARVSYPQDQEWNVAPIKCIAIANSARDKGDGNILALTADQPKEK